MGAGVKKNSNRKSEAKSKEEILHSRINLFVGLTGDQDVKGFF